MSTALIPLTDAVVLRGARAWQRIKSTAAEQRQLWREVGEALNYGRALHPSNQAFGHWCVQQGFDMDPRTRSDAMWFSASYDDPKTSLTHPTAIRKAHRASQADAKQPEELRQVQPQPTVRLEQRDAERVIKTIQRAESKDEGWDTAQRHLEALARKHGLNTEALAEAAKNGAPDTYFRFAPARQLALDNWRSQARADIEAMETAGVPRDAVKALLIHLAHNL